MKGSNFFKEVAESGNVSQTSVKVLPGNNFSRYDAEFVRQYVTKDSTILDMGAGTGLLANSLREHVGHIVAVEPFPSFSDFIERSDNVTVVNETLEDYCTTELFDFVLLFGIVQYIAREEIRGIYSKYRSMLKNNGTLMVKGQFGVVEDVIVDKYHSELKRHYYSEYRHLEWEKELLAEIGFSSLNSYDIYPPECNRWSNTHYYVIVATK